MWEMIFNFLVSKGYDVYSPSTHKGECKAPYLVLKDYGTMKLAGISSYDVMYDLLIYVPEKQFSRLESLVMEIRKAMKELEPIVLPLFTSTPSYHDKEIKAYMKSIQFKNHRKI